MVEEFIRKRIGELRVRIKGKKYSERQMSLDLGYNESYINSITNGKTLLSFQALEEICDYFEITLADFFNMEFEGKSSLTTLHKKLDEIDIDHEDVDFLVTLSNEIDQETFKGFIKFLRMVQKS